MMADKEDIRGRLVARLEDLEARVDRLEAEQREPYDDDLPEQAIEREDDEAIDATERAALREIEQTRQAIARIDAGVYGLCAGCGEPIDAARLAALPTALHCIECAREVGG